MCGIFGVAFASAGEPAGLEAALDAIAHRGPDDARTYRDPARRSASDASPSST